MSKTVLVAWGSTGSGKSSALNVIGGSYFRLKEGPIMHAVDLFEPIADEQRVELFKTSASVDSCTSETYIKDVCWFGNDALRDLVLVDTPGLGDSRGVIQDGLNIAEMVKKLRELPYGVNLFLLVLNAANDRFDENLTELIKIFQQIFDKDVWKNVAFLFTHWSGSEEEREDRAHSAPAGMTPEKHKEQQFMAKVAAITGGHAPPGAFFMDCNPRLRMKNAEGTIHNLKNLLVVARAASPFICREAKETLREKQRLVEEKAAEERKANLALEQKQEADRIAAVERARAAESERQKCEADRIAAVERARAAESERQKLEADRIAAVERARAAESERQRQEADRVAAAERARAAESERHRQEADRVAAAERARAAESDRQKQQPMAQRTPGDKMAELKIQLDKMKADKAAYELRREQTKTPVEMFHPKAIKTGVLFFGKDGYYPCCLSSSAHGCTQRGGYTMPPWKGEECSIM